MTQSKRFAHEEARKFPIGPTRWALLAVAIGALIAAVGCGANGAATDAGPGAGGASAGGSGGSGVGGGSAGSVGSNGGAGSGGGAGTVARGGSGGGGGTPVVSCPTAAPSAGQTCSGTGSCFYEDCAGSGRTVAQCTNGAWSVETGACTGVYCFSQTCAPGEICIMSAGGALLVQCVPNGCGTGAISCGCLQSCFGNCPASGSLQSGVTIHCNTCPSNQCA